MKRYLITLGAKTTAGGVVISASSHASITGAKVAVEGDQIQCPACHSIGVIQCTGPRHPTTLNGKAAALSDDLCRCACLKPPKLLASQSQRYQQLA